MVKTIEWKENQVVMIDQRKLPVKESYVICKDYRAVIRAIKKIHYDGYCTIESAPMVPDADTAARDGIEYLKFLERIVDYQLSPEFPNGYALPGSL